MSRGSFLSLDKTIFAFETFDFIFGRLAQLVRAQRLHR